MTNLTPQQLALIQGRKPWEAGTTIDGMFYQPHYSSGPEGEAGHGQGGQLLDIIGYDPNKTDVGQQYSMYGGGGDYQSQGAFKAVKDGDLMGMGLLAAISMGTLLPGITATGAYTPAMYGPLAGTAGAGAGNVGAGLGAAESVGGGAFNAALDSQLANLSLADPLAGYTSMAGTSGITGIPGLGTAASGVGGSAFNAAMDSQLANLSLADPLAGYTSMAGTTGITGIPGPGLLDTLANGAKSLLGPLASKTGAALGATALGGLLGSKGQQEEMTKTSKIDPRLDPYIYGDQGVLKQANDLKNQQLAQGGLNDLQRQGMQMTQNWLTSPEYSQGYTQMQNLGMGLLGRGVAPNPFGR
jgi:hypothetical protein